MFFRLKKSGPRSYLQIVENRREGRAVRQGLLAPLAFAFALERAVFVATLHRLFVSGSDRDCASWMQDYAIPGSESLSLHHFYRAMAWLGEELPGERQDHATPFSPRTIKDE